MHCKDLAKSENKLKSNMYKHYLLSVSFSLKRFYGLVNYQPLYLILKKGSLHHPAPHCPYIFTSFHISLSLSHSDISMLYI